MSMLAEFGKRVSMVTEVDDAASVLTMVGVPAAMLRMVDDRQSDGQGRAGWLLGPSGSSQPLQVGEAMADMVNFAFFLAL